MSNSCTVSFSNSNNSHNTSKEASSASSARNSTGTETAALALESKLHWWPHRFVNRAMKAAHRAQQLATERLRLAVEECTNAVAATVSAATQHLHAIQKEAGAGRGGTTATTLPPQQQEHSTLQREVQHVTKEVC
jgi:hypothetical protein